MARVARSLSMIGKPGELAKPFVMIEEVNRVQVCREDESESLWLPYSFRVIDELPWDQYTKGRLGAGWAYPLGRNRIESALRTAGARVGSLSLDGPDLPPRPGPLMVFDVFWLGDARAEYFGHGQQGHSALLMRWAAVPTGHRLTIASQLEAGWLNRGCEWAAAALIRGNAWSASEHRFLVTAEDTMLTLTEY